MGSSALNEEKYIYERKILQVDLDHLFKEKFNPEERKKSDIVAICYTPRDKVTKQCSQRLVDGKWKTVIKTYVDIWCGPEEKGKATEKYFESDDHGINKNFRTRNYPEHCVTVEYTTRAEALRRRELRNEVTSWLKSDYKLWDSEE